MSKLTNARHWCVTINNPTDVDSYDILPAGCTYLICGKEVGASGTAHFQMFVSFRKQVRRTAVQKVFPRGHLEVARHIQASIDYCKKDGDFCEFGVPPQGSGTRTDLEAFKSAADDGSLNTDDLYTTFSAVYSRYPAFCLGYLTLRAPKPTIVEHALYPWQVELTRTLGSTPCDRKITFVVDFDGNSGKTWFSRFYSRLHPETLLIQPGKKADITYILSQTFPRPSVVFFDCPRSKNAEFIHYDLLEEIKNGRIQSGKYQSLIFEFTVPHVVVFMNEEPDMTKLSIDRYDIIKV